MDPEDKARLAGLIRGQRWAALATSAQGAPHASMVAYTAEPDFAGFLLHLSRLSAHTRHLLADPRASLVISEPDPGRGDPQTLARVSLRGSVAELPRGGAAYARGRDLYVERLPQSEMLFGFQDFVLFRLVPEEARYVGGFGRAFTLSPSQLKSLAAI